MSKIPVWGKSYSDGKWYLLPDKVFKERRPNGSLNFSDQCPCPECKFVKDHFIDKLVMNKDRCYFLEWEIPRWQQRKKG